MVQMEVSFVSKAKIAFHSAAAKAEKVFADIKKPDSINNSEEEVDNQPADSSSPDSVNSKDNSKNCGEARNRRWKPAPIKAKQDWQQRLKNLHIGKRGEDTEKVESPKMAYAFFDENVYFMSEREIPQSQDSKSGSADQHSNTSDANLIPASAILRQLAIAVETGRNFTSIKDLLASSRASSPVRERAALSFSAVKSLVLREKEEKFLSEFGTDEKVILVIKSLLDAEGHFPGRMDDSSSGGIARTSLIKDIHGAPPESFVVKLSEALGSLKTLRKMSSLWCRIVVELRRLWYEEKHIPGIPIDEIPDLNSCLLYQQLQVINSCISRKRRRSAAIESLESVLSQASSDVAATPICEASSPEHMMMYGRTSAGEPVLRLGADKICENLLMLETGQPVFTPVLQEAPLLTEDVLKETEEFVLRTGSVGAGCSQLLSDMQAFKAANPGCILEDFVRWHSPPDWMEGDGTNAAEEASDGGDLSSLRGQLSRRMQKEGNLWRELWETAKPVPAMQQTPLFDEDLAVDGILNYLDDIPPVKLFEQLFISLLGSGFVVAEVTLSTNLDLCKVFNECKDYIISSCQGHTLLDKVEDMCQVYETVEAMLLNPEEFTKSLSQPEETTTPTQTEELSPAGELKNRFKRLGSIFGSKDRQAGKPQQKEQKNTDDNSDRQLFSSIFSKKPPKPSINSGSPADKSGNSLENGWTIV